MTTKTQSRRLQRVSEAGKDQIAAWKEGVSLSGEFGRPIDELLLQVAAARLRLAKEHLRDGNELMKSARPVSRSAISRYYYAMYHAFRAAAFLFHRGDDYEGHSVLPVHLPIDMPGSGVWQSKLKAARLTRNHADYESYPRSVQHWRTLADSLKITATAALKEVTRYLAAKGCRV